MHLVLGKGDPWVHPTLFEFDEFGNKKFQNGFEKLAFYFDLDQNGVIKGAELNKLKVWVDDGDAKTEDGELQSLEQHGITEIVIPGHNKMVSSTKIEKVEEKQTAQSFAAELHNEATEEESGILSIDDTQDLDVHSGGASIHIKSSATITVLEDDSTTKDKLFGRVWATHSMISADHSMGSHAG